MKWAEVQAHPCRCDGRLNPNHVFSSGMLVHRSCALHRCLCRRLYCWCWPLSFSQSLHLRSFQTCTLIPLDFSKQAINSVDSTFVPDCCLLSNSTVQPLVYFPLFIEKEEGLKVVLLCWESPACAKFLPMSTIISPWEQTAKQNKPKTGGKPTSPSKEYCIQNSAW